MVIVNEIYGAHEQVMSRVVQCLSSLCRGLWIVCRGFKSWLSICCGAFLAISPLIKLLVQPDWSIVIVLVIRGGGGGGHHNIHPWRIASDQSKHKMFMCGTCCSSYIFSTIDWG